MDFSLWEKTKRYRRIAAFAADDEAPQRPQRIPAAVSELKEAGAPATRSLTKD